MVAEKIARDYVGGLRELCHQNGLKLWLENYGHWGFPSEFLYYGGQSDEIGGEFWVGQTVKNGEIRAASSAAHIYGLRDVWSEAYTGGPNMRNTPRDLKAQGDESFCEGVTQFVLHVNIHQPDDTKRPGMAAWFGTEFNRHNTWFPESKAWIDYLRRSTVLLREGYPVADVAYFIGEDAPKMKGMRQPEIPAGYDWDFVNSDVILNRFQVKDRKLVLPEGTSYHVLVLARLPDDAAGSANKNFRVRRRRRHRGWQSSRTLAQPAKATGRRRAGETTRRPTVGIRENHRRR